MGSLLDLNLTPATNTVADVTISNLTTTPKLEPKDEPFDEPSNPNPNFTHSFTPSQPNGHNENDVYAKFNRISEMFRTAFSNKLDIIYDPNAQAIVPVPEENTLRRKIEPRSNELVRVTNLGIEDERFFRDVVRKTRMIYDSLTVFIANEDEKRKKCDTFGRGHSRGDLKSASVMKERGLWLNRDKRLVGAIPGV
nr:histone-lysine N-methyltransferase family member SUVH9-like [Tanacetum cinerariifolium]